MKKITNNAVNAFCNSANFSGNNTTVTVENGETKMFLFGNLIARKKKNTLEITNAGWRTNTTKERLNGLPNVSIRQEKGIWYLNGKEWKGEWTKIKTT